MIIPLDPGGTILTDFFFPGTTSPLIEVIKGFQKGKFSKSVRIAQTFFGLELMRISVFSSF